MKYCIETTDDGCIETLEISEKKKFTKRTIRTDYGCKSSDPGFSDQMEEAGYSDEIVENVFDFYDGFGNANFLDLAEMIHE